MEQPEDTLEITDAPPQEMPASSGPRLDGLGASVEVVLRAEELMPVLYHDLRQFARRQRRRFGAHDTMQTTAVISEAYLKLRHAPGFTDRTHFLRAAALAMRHVLVNYARDQSAAKRGSGRSRESLENAEDIEAVDEARLLDVNEALARLKELNLRLAQVVECRFFAGYDESQTAEALGLTDRTVRRDWVKARAWLRRELSDDLGSDS
jgi:RNA polymerase sigma factor (TIGR02999 family)